MGFPKYVRCVCNEDYDTNLTVGKIYTVVRESKKYIYLKEDDHLNTEAGYKAHRFEEVPYANVDGKVLSARIYDLRAPSLLPSGIGPVKRNKYSREIKPGVFVDVYDVLRAFAVTDPCLQHLLKKALAAGARGHKDAKEDLDDILASAKRAVEMYAEWESENS